MADNQRKKILIASPFFYPEPISTGKYSTFLAEKLVEKDHDVTVICSYPAWQPKFTRKTLAGVRVIRYSRGNGISQIGHF